MKSKGNPLIVRVPDPFDGSAPARLTRMGVIDKSGKLNGDVMPVFAGIFAGLFFDDICDYYDDEKDLLTVCSAFRELFDRQEHQHMYLMISIQYDCIRKPLPDPIWWLAGDNAAIREFMSLFVARLEFLMAESDFTPLEKKGEEK